MITVQAPPGQVKEHLSASHWTTQFPKGQIWLHCLTPGEQIIWQFPPVQLWLHSSAFDEQVILHSPPVQLCSHRLESQCNALHLPPVHDCVQFVMEEEQANLSQPPPVQDCTHSSYAAASPQRVAHGCGEQPPWKHVTLFDIPGSQLVLLLCEYTKVPVQDIREIISRYFMSIPFSTVNN